MFYLSELKYRKRHSYKTQHTPMPNEQVAISASLIIMCTMHIRIQSLDVINK